LAWALTATFIKTATETLTTFGISGMLTRWPVYALVAAVITGTLLNQSALHAGPLSASQPLLAILNPLASIILSIWLFDERFTHAVALAWAISHDPVVVIPGASTISQLEANAAAADITLTEDEHQALAAAASQVVPPPGQASPGSAAGHSRQAG